VERPSAIVEEKPIVKAVVPSDTKTLTAAQDAYDKVIANSQTLKIISVSQSRSRKSYYFTDSGRVFLKNTDRRATFKENDSVTLELGFLGSLFMTNQDDVRIKVKEMKVKD
jgi:predicted P-loop ATPase/GTPase